MFHIAAYAEAIDSTANNDVTPVTDDILVVQNNHFLPQGDMNLLFAYAGSATLSRARIVSPSNRQITIPFIRPVSVTLLPPTDPNVADYRLNPFRVRGLEELAMEATSGVAMTENFTGLIGLSTGLENMPRGDILTMRGTSTTAAVANTWTTLTMTWADFLPTGNYICVGMECQATNQKGARLIFENQYWRPGCVAITALGNRTHDMFRKGGLGVWGRFTSNRMPLVQVLNNGTDNSHEVYLDLMRVA